MSAEERVEDARNGTSEPVDPAAEDAYWREKWSSRPYAEGDDDFSFDDYSPAFRAGYTGFAEFSAPGTRFEDVEERLARNYEEDRGDSRMEWQQARVAARDAWDRVSSRQKR